MLLCRLGNHVNYKDEFKNNYMQYPNININKRIKRGKNLFHVACKYGHMNIISLLIDKAKINKQTKHHDKKTNEWFKETKINYHQAYQQSSYCNWHKKEIICSQEATNNRNQH